MTTSLSCKPLTFGNIHATPIQPSDFRPPEPLPLITGWRTHPLFVAASVIKTNGDIVELSISGDKDLRKFWSQVSGVEILPAPGFSWRHPLKSIKEHFTDDSNKRLAQCIRLLGPSNQIPRHVLKFVQENAPEKLK